MKYILMPFLVFFFSKNLQSQNFMGGFEISQNYTNVIFKNSFGATDKTYNPLFFNSYSLFGSYKLKNNIHFPVDIGIRKTGATYVYDNSNYSWLLQYIDFKLGLGFNQIIGDKNLSKSSFNFSVQGYSSYMLHATQNYNQLSIDLKRGGNLKSIDLGIQIKLDYWYKIKKNTSAFIGLRYQRGLANIEMDNNQKAFNTLTGLSIGLKF